MSLYARNETHYSKNITSIKEPLPPPVCLESDLRQLANYVSAYVSIGNVYSSIAEESYLFIDTKNHQLFNEYVGLLSEKLGVTRPIIKPIAVESFNDASIVSINSQIALEGWVSDLWNKIKGFFSKLYDKIKEFFKRYFTRLGRAKKGLENLIKTVEGTDKELKKPLLDNYTGSVLDKFKGTESVSPTNVRKTVESANKVTGALVDINKAAIKTASEKLVDANFIAKIKALKDQAASSARDSKARIDGISTKDKITNIANKATLGGAGKKGAENVASAKDSSKKLSDIAKNSEKEAIDTESTVNEAGTGDAGSDEANVAKGTELFNAFSKEVEDKLKPLIDIPLVGGKTITAVKVSQELELDIEIGNKDDKPSNVYLIGKADLKSLCKSGLDMIKSIETEGKNYGDVNDAIDKNMTTIDGIIKQIDSFAGKSETEGGGKDYSSYRKVVDKQVRTKLQLMQRFFTVYNKIGKNLLEVGMDTCEAITAYGVLSIKYYD